MRIKSNEKDNRIGNMRVSQAKKGIKEKDSVGPNRKQTEKTLGRELKSKSIQIKTEWKVHKDGHSLYKNIDVNKCKEKRSRRVNGR